MPAQVPKPRYLAWRQGFQGARLHGRSGADPSWETENGTRHFFPEGYKLGKFAKLAKVAVLARLANLDEFSSLLVLLRLLSLLQLLSF